MTVDAESEVFRLNVPLYGPRGRWGRQHRIKLRDCIRIIEELSSQLAEYMEKHESHTDSAASDS